MLKDVAGGTQHLHSGSSCRAAPPRTKGLGACSSHMAARAASMNLTAWQAEMGNVDTIKPGDASLMTSITSRCSRNAAITKLAPC